MPLKGENQEPSPRTGTCRVQCWVGKLIAMTPGMLGWLLLQAPLCGTILHNEGHLLKGGLGTPDRMGAGGSQAQKSRQERQE